MQKEVVKDQVRKEGTAWGYVRTVECECGRIAIFETWCWNCVECGNRYYLFSNNVRHLTKPATDDGTASAGQADAGDSRLYKS